VQRASILLITVALIAGIAGCVGGDGNGGDGSYTLIVDFTDGGTVAVDELPIPGKALLPYDAGTVVSLDASPSAGYRFVEWTGNVSSIADVNAASTTITMNDDYSVMAKFELIESAQYRLIISSTAGGSVSSPGEGTFCYDGGTGVNVLATPDSGHQFVSWTGNVQAIANANSASITMTMNDDYSIIANFEAIPPGQYSLTISSTTGGSVSTPGQGTFWYDAGAAVDLVTESEEGYKFFNWTGDVETMASFNASSSTKHNQPPIHFSITMDGSYAITAHFIPRWFVPTG
jgi:hypothetical protein